MALQPTDNLFIQRSPYGSTNYYRVNSSILFANANGFSSGTKMLFMMSSAPTGWTQDTSNQDALIRITSGSGGGTSGSINASTYFTNPYNWNLTIVGPITFTLGGTSLTGGTIPNHGHGINGGSAFTGNRAWHREGGQACDVSPQPQTHTSYGNSNVHFHPFTATGINSTASPVSSNFNISYAAGIVCVRN